MLFEVYFDADAKLRGSIKANYLNELFSLSARKELRESFEFLRNALVAANAKLYAIPGAAVEVPVTVLTKAIADGYRVDGVYVDGVNVLRLEEDMDTADDEGRPLYARKDVANFEAMLSNQMKLPASQLKVTYSPPAARESASLRIKMGSTVSKR